MLPASAFVTGRVATPFEAVAEPRPVTVPAPPVLAKATTVELSLVTVLPCASRTVAVRVCVSPERSEPDCASTICVAGPCVKVTSSESASAAPLSVPVIVAEPTVVGEVSVAVYVPSPLSVTPESEPVPARESATTPPEAPTSLPTASFSCTVTVDVVTPSATIESGSAEIVEVDVEAVPGEIE